MNDNDSGFGAGLGRILQLISLFLFIGLVIRGVRWAIGQGIESWRTKDENYHLDLIGLKICGIVMAVGLLGLVIACIVSPEFRNARPHVSAEDQLIEKYYGTSYSRE